MIMDTPSAFPFYDPTALFAGSGPYQHRPVTYAQDASQVLLPSSPGVLPRGTLVGRRAIVVAPGAVTATPAMDNTGNGTVTPDPTSPALSGAKAGSYAVTFTSPTTFDVLDPNGRKLKSGVIGASYADELKFTVVAGSTAFLAGDSYLLTLAADDSYALSRASAIDGSATAFAIVAADIDISVGPVVGPAYCEGVFAFERMIVDPSWTYAELGAALRTANSELFLRSVGTPE